MSKPYTPENLPGEYPIDKGLLTAANLASGIDVHDRNEAISNYQFWVKEFAARKSSRSWFRCLNWERKLRGILHEASAGRFTKVKPLHEPPTT